MVLYLVLGVTNQHKAELRKQFIKAEVKEGRKSCFEEIGLLQNKNVGACQFLKTGGGIRDKHESRNENFKIIF